MSKLVRNSLLPRCVYYLPVYMWLPDGVRKKNSIYRIHINQKMENMLPRGYLNFYIRITLIIISLKIV